MRKRVDISNNEIRIDGIMVGNVLDQQPINPSLYSTFSVYVPEIAMINGEPQPTGNSILAYYIYNSIGWARFVPGEWVEFYE